MYSQCNNVTENAVTTKLQYLRTECVIMENQILSSGHIKAGGKENLN